jgi:hypothetical protein
VARVYRGRVGVSIEAVQRLHESASLPAEVKEVGSSSLLVMMFDPSLRCIDTFGRGTPVLTALTSRKASKSIDT